MLTNTFIFFYFLALCGTLFFASLLASLLSHACFIVAQITPRALRFLGHTVIPYSGIKTVYIVLPLSVLHFHIYLPLPSLYFLTWRFPSLVCLDFPTARLLLNAALTLVFP